MHEVVSDPPEYTPLIVSSRFPVPLRDCSWNVGPRAKRNHVGILA
jgi:hypothetical protein